MIESLVPSASSFSSEIDQLFLVITLIVGFWFFLVEFVIFYLIFKFKKKEGVGAQYLTGETHEEKKWIHIPHYLVILCDIVIIVWTISLWSDIKQELPPADAKIRIIGQQWTWIFEHPGPDGLLDTPDDISTVNELHVEIDKTYHFELQSKDVLHSFSVPVFRLKQDAIPGRIINGWFKPTKEVVADVQCAEMCGIGHGIMGAKIFVKNKEAYQQWMADMSQSNPGLASKNENQPSEDSYTGQLLSGF